MSYHFTSELSIDFEAQKISEENVSNLCRYISVAQGRETPVLHVHTLFPCAAFLGGKRSMLVRMVEEEDLCP